MSTETQELVMRLLEDKRKQTSSWIKTCMQFGEMRTASACAGSLAVVERAIEEMESIFDNLNEAAYDRHQERQIAGDIPSVQEQYERASEEKRKIG